MKEDQEKKLDDFIRKIVKEGSFDEPPQDFTDSVMDRIRSAGETESRFAYQPLVTGKVWFLVVLLTLGACVYMLTTDQQLVLGTRFLPFAEYLSGLGTIEFWETKSLDNLGSINIHKSVIYAVLMLPVFFFIQIFYLKRKQLY